MTSLLLIEAIIVGILLLIIAVPVMKIQDAYFPSNTASPQKYWAATVVTGVLVHLFCEFSGLNKYYCKKGHACVTP